ncbi:MAG TPA: threonine synthase, partial [Clostridiales bacterium]|nr:threonine synthase [Clostridiales bacterium]
YKSTRGNAYANSSQEAILKGLAEDGGLYVPEHFTYFSINDLKVMSEGSYIDVANRVLCRILDDYREETIKRCTSNAYSTGFENNHPAPVVNLNKNTSVLELWHGPTCAFKDMALQLLPELMTSAIHDTGADKTVLILVATSGDTGKAALEGFKDVEGTEIMVFFPEHGVSDMQKLQMITQEGSIVHSVAISGNFDDAQTGVKRIFTNTKLIEELDKGGYMFSSANSINWGRLVPQIVYYFSSYVALLKEGVISCGERINFAVPTGNFGNILAGYYAAKMGLPVNKLICASNKNNVLTDFFHKGVYDRKRTFYRTHSPSMDILISSNLERLIYDAADKKSETVSGFMSQLKETGSYEIPEEIRMKLSDLFTADYIDDDQTAQVISRYYNQYGYLSDTHTAVALGVLDLYREATQDSTHTVVVSTASPYKFGKAVAQALIKDQDLEEYTEYDLLKLLERETSVKIPQPISDVINKPVLHSVKCSKDAMSDTLRKLLL